MMSTLIILPVDLLPSKWVRHAQPMMATLAHVKLRCAAHHSGTTHGLYAKETPTVIQIVFRPWISDAIAFMSNLRDMNTPFAPRPKGPRIPNLLRLRLRGPSILDSLTSFPPMDFAKKCSESQGPSGPWCFMKFLPFYSKKYWVIVEFFIRDLNLGGHPWGCFGPVHIGDA